MKCYYCKQPIIIDLIEDRGTVKHIAKLHESYCVNRLGCNCQDWAHYKCLPTGPR